jgi:hypothetical protein
MLINNFLKIHTRLMLDNFRLVLVINMMMDSHHHHGVWKTLAVLRVVSHVCCLPNFASFFRLFLIMRASLSIVASSPFHRLQQPSFLF